MIDSWNFFQLAKRNINNIYDKRQWIENETKSNRMSYFNPFLSSKKTHLTFSLNYIYIYKHISISLCCLFVFCINALEIKSYSRFNADQLLAFIFVLIAFLLFFILFSNLMHSYRWFHFFVMCTPDLYSAFENKNKKQTNVPMTPKHVGCVNSLLLHPMWWILILFSIFLFQLVPFALENTQIFDWNLVCNVHIKFDGYAYDFVSGDYSPRYSVPISQVVAFVSTIKIRHFQR